jgi:hypothetical protein
MLKLLSRVLLAALVLGAALLGSAPSSAAPALATRSSDEAGVRVVVTPKALGRDVTVWEFNVVMDTHTKPLNDNLAQAAVLVDEAGRRYVPVAWQGDPPGGHHRKGVLQFSPPAEMPKSIELQINGVGGAATRMFRWTIE